MPVSVDSYEHLAGEVLKLYEQAENTMLRRVANRVARGVTKSGWTEQKYKEMGTVRREMQSFIAEISRDREAMSRRFIEEAYTSSSSAFVMEARQFASLSGLEHLSPNSVKVIQILSDLENTMDAADRMILRRADDAYARIVGEVSAQVAAGAITVREAVSKELERFADKGIGAFIDKAGRVWEMSTYAEMATLTAIERATIAGYVDTMQEYGFDLAIISSHFGACPLCEPWQDVIVSVSGMNPDYHSLDEAEDAGCFHPRCLHDISTYFEGVTRQGHKEPAPIKPASEGYSVRAQQRALERQVRRWKRRMTVAQTPQEERLAYARVRQNQERIRNLINQYNATTPSNVDWLPRKYWREGGKVSLSEPAKKLEPVSLSSKETSLNHKQPTHQKVDSGGRKIIPEALYNKLTNPVEKAGGLVLRNEESEKHLDQTGNYASHVGGVLFFRRSATISDVLEETYHFWQERKELFPDVSTEKRVLLLEIDAKKHLISYAKKYKIPSEETELTKRELEFYQKELERWERENP